MLLISGGVGLFMQAIRTEICMHYWFIVLGATSDDERH